MVTIKISKMQVEIIKAIGVLYSQNKDVNPFSVSKLVGCGWETAKRNLQKLKEIK